MAPISDIITIYRPDVFDCFRDGARLGSGESIDAEQWFATAIAEQYQDIADRHGCRIELSTARLEEARSLWSHDTAALTSRLKRRRIISSGQAFWSIG